MRKVAFLLFSGRKFGGMERRYVRLFAHLCRQGMDGVLLSTHDAVEGARALGIEIPVERIRFIDFELRGSNKLVRKTNRLYGLINALLRAGISGYQQVHIVSNPGLLVSLYARLSSLLPRYSFSVVDSRLGFSSDLITRTVGPAYAVDCLSETIGEYVRARCRQGDDVKKVRVAPCSFIDLESIDAVHQERDIDVAMIARFSPEKGYSLLLEALPRMPGDLVLHLCGFGADPPVTPRAEVYEAKDPIAVLAKTKIFLSIQQRENYPSQALLEAMACGCAIIATDVGETRKLLDESCAILIPARAECLADAVTCLMINPDRRRQLGAAARKRISEGHTLGRFSDYFEREILGTELLHRNSAMRIQG